MSDEPPDLGAFALQVDLDPVWCYLRSYTGESPDSSAEDPVYVLALPRILTLASELALKVTFFAVGREVLRPQSRSHLLAALAAGHEIANHSYRHPLGLSKRGLVEVRDEIVRAQEALEQSLGVTPKGFRAPGWDISGPTLEILADLGYSYDASVVPSWLGVAENAALKVLSRFRAAAGFGDWRLCLAPTEPYFPDFAKPWRQDPLKRLVEVPAGVIARTRLPYRATIQFSLGRLGIEADLRARAARPLVYTAHGIDFLDRDEMDQAMHRHPSAQWRLDDKDRTLRSLFRELSSGRRPLTTAEVATEAWRSRSARSGEAVR